jgi:predicted ATPase/transcriptional regulator with XRE-family HTH domain
MNLTEFGKQLQTLRKARHWSQESLLESLDQLARTAPPEEYRVIDSTLLSRWERAHRQKGRTWRPTRTYALHLIQLFAPHLDLPGAQQWAAQAGYTLHTAELQTWFPTPAAPPNGATAKSQPEPATQTENAPTMSHNLPTIPNTIVGRKTEISTAIALLQRDDVWLVTLIGPGGSGKTRLALEIAFTLAPDFADGLIFVDLAPVQNPTLVLPTIAHTLGLQEAPGQLVEERLRHHLQGKQILLLLDNFEQVGAAAPRLTELHQYAPQLTLLVTSRARLRLRGEKEVPVPPLPLPERGETLENVAQSEAVALFIERVQDVQPSFVLTESNAGTVTAICTHLDGLPLAIELAAARGNLLDPLALLAGLAEPLRLLTRGPRDLPDRQQTLRAMIAWSYNLLTAEEQTLFRRLAVFAGGFTLEAVNAVCATGEGPGGPAPFATLDGLATLVDNNLVQQKEVKGELRFRLLKTIREFAREQLEQADESEAVCWAHAAYFLRLTELNAEAFRERGSREFLSHMETEVDNLRAAIDWVARRDPALEMQILAYMLPFWNTGRYMHEGWRWIELRLPHIKPECTTQYGDFLHGLGHLYWKQGDFAKAQTYAEESVTLWRHLENPFRLGWTLNLLAGILMSRSDYAAARVVAEEQLEIMRKLEKPYYMACALRILSEVMITHGNDTQAHTLRDESVVLLREVNNPLSMSQALTELAKGALIEGDVARACTYFENVLDIVRNLNEPWMIAQTLVWLGRTTWRQGDKARATVLLEENLALTRELGAKEFLGASLVLLGLAAQENNERQRASELLTESLTVAQESRIATFIAYTLSGFGGLIELPTRSAQILGAAARLLTTAPGRREFVAEHAHHDRIVASVRTQLDEATFAAAWREGQAMRLEEAIAYALDSPSPSAGAKFGKCQGQPADQGAIHDREVEFPNVGRQSLCYSSLLNSH